MHTTVTRFRRKDLIPVAAAGIVAVTGSVLLFSSQAATPFVAAEPELGTLTGNAVLVSDSAASGGKYVRFGASGGGTYKADLNFDFDTGNYSQWLTNQYGGFEVGDYNTSHQTKIVTTTRNGSGYANRYELHNDPIDKASGTFRALWGKYDSNDGLPTLPEVYWGFSLMLPQEGGQTAVPGYEHLWELHQRQNIYRIPACAIAPHAVMIRNNRLEYRMMTGACKWTGTSWNGYTAYHDQVPILPSVSLGTWYDVIVHIKFSEQTDGKLEVWGREAGQPWPASPQVNITNATLPYIPGGLDPAIPTKQSTTTPDSNGNTGLYLQSGLYTGGSTWPTATGQHIHISDNLRRYPTLTDAKLGFPQ